MLTRGRVRPATLIAGLVVLLFLLSRFLFLDADLPDFRLSEYSPIDEFAYAVPAFNLYHYGTWTHQLAPWAPVEGWPMNIVQNVLTALTMAVGGYTYMGLRASSVIFALLAFAFIWRISAATAREAVTDRLVSDRTGRLLVAFSVSLLLVDFGSIASARAIEPTISRLAAVGLVVWAVERGWFLSRDQSTSRAAVFGLVCAAAVWLVYIYNLFLLPGALIALIACTFRTGGVRRTIVQAGAFALGAAISTAAYFGAVALVYGQNPADWYRVWIAGYSGSERFGGLSITNVASMLDANLFRFDGPLLLLVLLGLPIFLWWTAQSKRPWALLTVSLLALFILQSAAVADYPYRKFLIVTVFAVPIAITAILRGASYWHWLRARPPRLILGAVYAVLVVIVFVEHLVSTNLGAPLTRLIELAAVLFVAGSAAFLIAPRFLRTPIAAILAVTILLPLAYVDWREIYHRPTYTYRDALIASGQVLNGHVTAGDLSFAMQLYNTSTPVLEGYVYGLTREEYNSDVVRAFTDGHASWLFAYTRPAIRAHWEAEGFRLVETYSIKLPNGWLMGRYAYGPKT